MNSLNNDVLGYLLDFLVGDQHTMDLQSIGRLGQCSKRLRDFTRSRNFWLEFYRSMFPAGTISDNSVHMGPQTWITCRIGPYPGWAQVHNTIDKPMACRKLCHYQNLNKKSIRWKNLFKMSTRRYRTLLSKKNTWGVSHDYRLEELINQRRHIDREIKKLEDRKKCHFDLEDRFGAWNF